MLLDVQSSSSMPGARAELSLAFDSRTNSLLVVGGFGYALSDVPAGEFASEEHVCFVFMQFIVAGVLSDIWEFDIVRSLWIWTGGSSALAASVSRGLQSIPVRYLRNPLELTVLFV
jgi:hypothetical protein